MVKVKGPLFSQAAHGRIGDAVTYSKRKTHNHARYQRKQRTFTSEDQLIIRDKFYASRIIWGMLTIAQKALWKTMADVGWIEIDEEGNPIPRAYGVDLARRHRNTILPKIIIEKGVPPTNQTVVYHAGDDGTYQAGIEPEVERFVSNVDGTVYDQTTKLMWVADPSVLGGLWGEAGTPNAMTWINAVGNCNTLDYAGYRDWRMPNLKELESLLDFSRTNPSIDPVKFPNTQNAAYWYSTLLIAVEPTGYAYIRPVRNIPVGHKYKSHRKAK